MCVSLLSLACIIASSAIGQETKHIDQWKPFRVLIGEWVGTTDSAADGKPNATCSFKFALGNSCIEMRARVEGTAQPGKPGTKPHEELSILTYDRSRRLYVLRQFHSEGLSQRFVHDGIPGDGGSFVFVSEAIENVPEGWRMRATYRIKDGDKFEVTLDRAPPGKDFKTYRRIEYHRK